MRSYDDLVRECDEKGQTIKQLRELMIDMDQLLTVEREEKSKMLELIRKLYEATINGSPRVAEALLEMERSGYIKDIAEEE